MWRCVYSVGRRYLANERVRLCRIFCSKNPTRESLRDCLFQRETFSYRFGCTVVRYGLHMINPRIYVRFRLIEHPFFVSVTYCLTRENEGLRYRSHTNSAKQFLIIEIKEEL